MAFDVNNLPKSEICISIVSNINGKLFFLAHTKEDTGKECLKLSYYKREEPKLPYNYTPIMYITQMMKTQVMMIAEIIMMDGVEKM